MLARISYLAAYRSRSSSKTTTAKDFHGLWTRINTPTHTTKYRLYPMIRKSARKRVSIRGSRATKSFLVPPTLTSYLGFGHCCCCCCCGESALIKPIVFRNEHDSAERLEKKHHPRLATDRATESESESDTAHALVQPPHVPATPGTYLTFATYVAACSNKTNPLVHEAPAERRSRRKPPSTTPDAGLLL